MTFGRLPNFFIIGAAKSGTTTLHDCLKQHPEVFLPTVKEPMFFNRESHFNRGFGWYEEGFFRGAENYSMRGEATPHYLYWSDKVAPRIANLYGDRLPKLLVILRDPVHRAYSMYWNMRREGRDDLSFAQAIEQEGQRLEQHWQYLDEQGSMLYGYFRGGCYASLLAPYLERFPRENFLFLLQEDLKSDLQGTTGKILRFLGVDDSLQIERTESNRSSMPRSRALHNFLRKPSRAKDAVKPFIPTKLQWKIVGSLIQLNLQETSYTALGPKIEYSLRQSYREEISRLESFIDRDLSHWKAPS